MRNKSKSNESNGDGSNGDRQRNVALSSWLRLASQQPLLTEEQERELAQRMERGDKEARRVLIESNLRLVSSIAVKYQHPAVPLEDLIQEGTIGLIQAVDSFDWRRETRFSTFAVLWVKQAVLRARDRYARTIGLSLRFSEDMHKVSRVQGILTQRIGRPPSTEEIAKEVNMTPKRVEELLNCTEQTMTSLHEPSNREEECVLEEALLNENAVNPEDALIEKETKKELREELQGVLSDLPPMYQTVIRLRFGLDDGDVKTYSDIGKRLGLTRQRAMQITELALQQLRSHPRLRALVSR